MFPPSQPAAVRTQEQPPSPPVPVPVPPAPVPLVDKGPLDPATYLCSPVFVARFLSLMADDGAISHPLPRAPLRSALAALRPRNGLERLPIDDLVEVARAWHAHLKSVHGRHDAEIVTKTCWDQHVAKAQRMRAFLTDYSHFAVSPVLLAEGSANTRLHAATYTAAGADGAPPIDGVLKIIPKAIVDRATVETDIHTALMDTGLGERSIIRLHKLVQLAKGATGIFMERATTDAAVYIRQPRPAAEPLPVTELLGMALGLARSLQAVHAEGVIHRDVALRNLLRRASDGAWVLADFGLARRVGASEPAAVTEELSHRGPLHSMAPEAVRRGTYGPETDVFMFGCALLHLFTGKVRFEDELYDAVHALAWHGTMPTALIDQLEQTHPLIAGLVSDCLLPIPCERPTLQRMIAILKNAKADYATTVLIWRSERLAEERRRQREVHGAAADADCDESFSALEVVAAISRPTLPTPKRARY